jgi:hypothetical protein
MAMWDNLARSGRRLAGDLQASVVRARLEGERRLLQRQHRAAAERLGERAWELTRSGELDPSPLRAEIADVDRILDEIAAKVAEIEGVRDDDSGPPAEAPAKPTGWEDADRFFRD